MKRSTVLKVLSLPLVLVAFLIVGERDVQHLLSQLAYIARRWPLLAVLLLTACASTQRAFTNHEKDSPRITTTK
ncbi:hypothetical protein [Hymenobacter koreensis]|uniref:Uncharacterized protein n=1 Tax=Hymenobacter koreensis TaxID=1084523 RepID=A0ABP8JK46_9BACT